MVRKSKVHPAIKAFDKTGSVKGGKRPVKKKIKKKIKVRPKTLRSRRIDRLIETGSSE